MYWDVNNPYIPKSPNMWKYKKLCNTLNGEHRKPSPHEWDILIDFNYPEENRILEKLDQVNVIKTKKMCKMYNYTRHIMGTNKKVKEYISVPCKDKNDYI